MASIQYVVTAVDAASGVFAKIAASADGLDKQLADLSKRVATPEVDLKDAKFTLGMINAAKRLDRLSAMVADPSVEVDTAKAQTEILRITAMLDRLDAKRVNVGAAGGGGLLGRLGAGALGGVAGSVGPGLGAAGLGASVGLLGALAVAATQAAAALAAAGAGVAAFGALSIPQFTAVSGALSQIKADTNAYERATTAAGKSLALKHIRQDWADLNGPQAAAVRGIQSLQSEFGKLSAKLAPITFKVLNDGLRIANQLLPSLLPFATAAGNAIDGLLKGLGKFTQAAGFKAFVSQLQALSGPAITALGQGLGQIAISVGKLILAAAQPDSIRSLSRVLGFLATVIDVAAWAITRMSGNMQKWIDIAHQTASKFDEFRHDAARVFAAVATIFDMSRHMVATWGHDIAHTFDSTRRTAAQLWNTLWQNTVAAARRGVSDVLHFVGSLPRGIKGLFASAGTWLLQAGKNVITGLLNGLKSAWKTVTSFISGIASWIKAHKGPIGLDAKLLEPAGRALMNGLLRGLVGGFGPIAGFIGGVAGKIAGLFGFHGGGSTVALGRAMAASIGWTGSQWSALFNLWQGESGWNPRARNPSSGAFGIPQALPPGKMGAAAVAGDAAAQIRWGLGYIRAVYGNPANAYRMWLSRSPHWYGGGTPPGGILFSRPQLIGVGDRPERVEITPVGSRGRRGSGPLVHVEQMVVQDATDMSLVASRLNFAIYAASLGS